MCNLFSAEDGLQKSYSKIRLYYLSEKTAGLTCLCINGCHTSDGKCCYMVGEAIMSLGR